jgi:fatty acid desaturase
MKTVYNLTLQDPTFTPRDYTLFERFWIDKLNDERDLPFVYLSLNITLFMLPLGIMLFIPALTGWLWWAIAIAYLIMNNFVFKGPFGLMLHCTSHRTLFNSDNKMLNVYIPWILAPFFGHTPETYYVHHIAMHHRENNMEEDLSSTMHYQRDSFRDFIHYLGDFLFFVIPSLALYFNKRNQLKLRNRILLGEGAFWTACIALSFLSWQATLVVFLIPFLTLRIVMMVGNWAQHSFVDPDDPDNFYKNSITCINTKYNNKCWNDGYHISHHIKPNLHWTLHPDHLLKNKDEYAKNHAFIFEGIHFLHVWYFLMTKNYQALAKRLINLNGIFATDEEAIALMRHRASKIPKSETVAA